MAEDQPAIPALHRVRRWSVERPWPLAVAVLVVIAAVAATCSLLASNDQTTTDWYEPLWDGPAGTYADVCTQGVCVADLVALPARRPVEAVTDLALPETLGALSVERLWTADQGGLFGTGWASVWDIRLVEGRLRGPLPAVPVTRPAPGKETQLADGSRIHLGADGRVDRICVDGARCVEAERSHKEIVLKPAGDPSATVRLTTSAGRVSEASTSSGRIVRYRYTNGRLAAVAAGSQPTTYDYDRAGRLVAIADGASRSFSYDAGLVTATVDRDGRTWDISGNDGEFEVVAPDKTVRTYRFAGEYLVEVEDSKLGVLVHREMAGGVVTAEERPADGVRTERIEDGRLRITEQRPGAPPRIATLIADAHGRIVRSDGPDGATTVRYDGPTDRPVEVDHNGAITTYQYDDRGLLLATVDADDYRIEIGRNASGLPVRISDGLLVNEFAYDGAGRVVEEGPGKKTARATYRADGLIGKITDRADQTLEPSYDEQGRLTSLGAGAQDQVEYAKSGEVAAQSATLLGLDATTDAVPKVPVAEVRAGPDGTTEYRYASGDMATFDAAGRLTTVTVDGATTTRRFDDAGRISELTQPGGETYAATYTPAGRLAMVNDGIVTAELAWHGSLLVSATTSSGSKYRYDYDTEGQLISASLGDLTWSYGYNQAGLLTAMHRPTGTTSYEWNAGRPTSSFDGSTLESYTWDTGTFDLKAVTRDGEKTVSIKRDGQGRVVSVVGPEGEASFRYDGTTERLAGYHLADGLDAKVAYDKAGKVSKLIYGSRVERWKWLDGQVTKVSVEGEDDPYLLDWSAPGLLERVRQSDKTLMRAEADDRGRITQVVDRENEAVASLDWARSGLAKASLGDWELTAGYDKEHRPTTVKIGDLQGEWVYTAGAVDKIKLGDDSTGFDYASGHLAASEQRRGSAVTKVEWDDTGSRALRVESPEGTADFSYDDQRVARITYKDQVRPVTYDDKKEGASAEGAGGELLRDLFDERGNFQAGGAPSSSAPWAPWFDRLPSELGFTMPDVVTGDDVVATALDGAFPETPMPLVPDGKRIAEHAAGQVISLATTATLPVGPDRFLDLPLGPDGPGLDGIMNASPTAAVAESATNRLAPDPSLFGRAVGVGKGLIGGLVNAGSAIYGFLTSSALGRTVLTVTFFVGTFLIGAACGAVVACHVAAAIGLSSLSDALAGGDGGIVAALTDAALGPLTQLRAIADGDPAAILSAAALAATLGAGALSTPAARSVATRLTAPACNLRRLVCVSASRYGAAAEHVIDAQQEGAARLLRIDRAGAQSRRASALRSMATRAGFDRDEYPFAVSSRRAGLSIRYIDPTSNRALGSYLGRQLSVLPDGARFFVLPIA